MTNASSLAAYADLFNRLLDCILLVDPSSSTVLEANPACERTIGLTPEAVVGRPLLQYIDESQRDDFSKALRVAFRRYYPRQFESNWKLPDGRRRVLEVVACPLKLSNQQEILQVVLRDITYRREAEQNVQMLLLELQEANATMREQNKKLEELSIRDGMTGLYNYRHFKTLLGGEHERSTRFRRPYGILFCDMDNFKNYNDKNGHPAGDELLRGFAKLLAHTVRSVDVPARYGGEEFVVICPDTDIGGMMVLGERFRKLVESTPFPHMEKQPLGKVTVSIGIASFPEHGKTPEEVVHAADQAVYVSKKTGRNRVTAAGAVEVQKKAA